jgi:hypothetical protein
LHLSEQFNAKTPRRKDITGIVLDVNSDCPLSLWERVGVRVITGLLQYLLPLIPTFSQGEKESFVNNHIDFQITTVLNKPNP